MPYYSINTVFSTILVCRPGHWLKNVHCFCVPCMYMIFPFYYSSIVYSWANTRQWAMRYAIYFQCSCTGSNSPLQKWKLFLDNTDYDVALLPKLIIISYDIIYARLVEPKGQVMINRWLYIRWSWFVFAQEHHIKIFQLPRTCNCTCMCTCTSVCIKKIDKAIGILHNWQSVQRIKYHILFFTKLRWALLSDSRFSSSSANISVRKLDRYSPTGGDSQNTSWSNDNVHSEFSLPPARLGSDFEDVIG